MNVLKLNTDYANISEEQLSSLYPAALEAKQLLHSKQGKGNDFLGWLDYSLDLKEELLKEIEDIAEEIKQKADVLLVIGIGGSYLGAKAALESLRNSFINNNAKKYGKLDIYFIGQNMSAEYISELFEHIKGQSVYANVISKSGTTTEPAIAFRIVKSYIEALYGKEEAKNRIIATTDEKRGALRTLSDQEGYRTFVIPDDVGGRFSVITPVGLLPIACADISIRDFLAGFNTATLKYREKDSLEENEALKYAVLRNLLYQDDKTIEILVNYEPKLNFIAEWWKQLYGESEGKEGKGIYPSSLSFTTDLHSVGQYVQQGRRCLFETLLRIMKSKSDLKVQTDEQNLDGLNFLSGKSIYEINETALKATMLAHYSGGVPNIVIEIADWDAYHLGYLFSFFMHGVAYSGYILDVNPFDQPGVEDYKKNMFALLDKPGYEDYKKELVERFGL